MMTTRKQSAAGIALAALFASPVFAPAASGAATRPLTKSTAAVIAKREALAAIGITPGDTATASCKAIGHGVFRCQATVIPVRSTSRCHLTELIRLVHGQATVDFPRAGSGCSG